MISTINLIIFTCIFLPYKIQTRWSHRQQDGCGLSSRYVNVVAECKYRFGENWLVIISLVILNWINLVDGLVFGDPGATKYHKTMIYHGFSNYYRTTFPHHHCFVLIIDDL